MTGKAIEKVKKELTPKEKGLRANVQHKLQQQAKGVDYYIQQRGHVSNVCRQLKIDRSTWYRWLNDKRFNLAIQQADKALDDDMEQVLIGKADRGSSAELLFYLKKRHERYKDQPTTIGVKGEKVEVIIQDYK